MSDKMMSQRHWISQCLCKLLLFYLCIYNIQAEECPQPCSCTGAQNLTVNCSSLGLVNLPLTFTSTLILDLSHNALGPIMNSSFVQMRNLSLIDLSYNGLTRLLGCTFSGMFELKTARLSNNLLTSLPDSLFTDANKVENLDVSFNLLTEVPDEVFRNTPQLKTLDLSHNKIVQLKLGQRFQVPRHIRAIDFSYNQIEAVSGDSFQVASFWEGEIPRSINMAFCRLSSVDQRAFSSIPYLHVLDLSGNSELPNDILKTLIKSFESKNLESLSLASMNLTSVFPIFSNLSQISLKFLNLSFNSLTDIPANTFTNMQNLSVVDISWNSLSSLSDGFSDLRNLHVLNISNNKLESLHGNPATQLSNLRVLDISHNKLSDHSRVSLSHMVNLNRLNVNKNQLSSAVLPNRTLWLQYLDYSYNRITEFHGVEDATLLEFVDLSNNNISSLPGLLFKSARFLKNVNFSRNSIILLDHGAFLPQSPLVVDLSYNLLKEVRYSNWVATQKLYLNHNELTVIDNQAFYGMSGLDELDLSQNKLASLHEDLFQYLAHLKRLNLSYNSLDNVQWFYLFRSLEFLLSLDISYNSLSHMNESMFLPLFNIEIISLRYNRLRTINPRAFREMRADTHIDISHNPFDCSCASLDFIDWLKKTNIHVHGLYDLNSTAYQCRTPDNRAGLHITQWNTVEFECDKTMLYVIAFCSTFALLSLVTLVAVGVFRLYRKWKARKKLERDAVLEEELSRRAKKGDVVRLINKNASKELHKTSNKNGNNNDEDVVKRNGYVPWPGHAQKQYEEGRRKGLLDNRKDSTRIVDKDKEKEEERISRGRHYERLNRGAWVGDTQDDSRGRDADERMTRKLHQNGKEQFGVSERSPNGRSRENIDVRSPHRGYRVLPHESLSHYDDFKRHQRQRNEREERFYYDGDPRYRGDPYIISSANTFPKRWDASRGWEANHGWTQQGYKIPRIQAQRSDVYLTRQSEDRGLGSPDREAALRGRSNNHNIDRYPLEVHFHDETKPGHYPRPRRDDLQHYNRQRSYSYSYLPDDYPHEMPPVKMDRSQRDYESIEQARQASSIGHRAASQPYLYNEDTSGWL